MNKIKLIKNELRTDSRGIAHSLDRDHKVVIELIDKYLDELRTISPVPFETERGKALPQGGFGQSIRYALLNEDQCYFILTLMRNTTTVVKAKLSLVKAFSEARKLSRGVASIEWNKAREEGKLARKVETDVIKMFVEYATKQGSKNANFYYANITKGTYKALFIIERGSNIKGVRDVLSTFQLNQLNTAEIIVQKAIAEHMEIGTHYKDIYKIAVSRVEELAHLLGKQLPGQDNVLQLQSTTTP